MEIDDILDSTWKTADCIAQETEKEKWAVMSRLSRLNKRGLLEKKRENGKVYYRLKSEDK